jgi:hypothetical protein
MPEISELMRGLALQVRKCNSGNQNLETDTEEIVEVIFIDDNKMTAAGPVKRKRRTTSNRWLNCDEVKRECRATSNRSLNCNKGKSQALTAL